jgi:hypothetical protein
MEALYSGPVGSSRLFREGLAIKPILADRRSQPA